jgi:hypothetical protein
VKYRSLRWPEYLVRIKEKRNACRLLVGKPEGKGTLGKPRRSWLDNIVMELVEIGQGGANWIGLAQDREIYIYIYICFN